MQATIRNFLRMESAGGIVLRLAAALRNLRGPESSQRVRRPDHKDGYFVNAGIDLGGIGFGDLLHAVPTGIATGLFVGKQLGIILGSVLSGIMGCIVLRLTVPARDE